MVDMHTRCASIIANVWDAYKSDKPVRTATAEFGESVHLGEYALKRRWQEEQASL